MHFTFGLSYDVRRVVDGLVRQLNKPTNCTSTALNWRKLPTEGTFRRSEGETRSIQNIVLEDALSDVGVERLDDLCKGRGGVRRLEEAILDQLSDVMDMYLTNPVASNGNSTPSTSTNSSAANSPRVKDDTQLRPDQAN